ncbi:uncharacterized protein [Paramormyrops kingsleyae]|uniref:uncharacterized protein isoform X3 n=1 Tax=Paramormyrops kingsleyae TaxID=1676925 RepID=UPI003B97167A
MMRRARISVRPNVRPVGRGPSSSKDGQSMLASTVNSLAAGETSQTIEMVSNVTDNEPAPEESVIKFPEASEFTSTHDTLSEKALCNLGENGQTCEASGDCIPADTSLKRKESVSGVCDIAQPRVIPKHLSAKALESSVSKAVTMASCSVAPVSVPDDQTVTEDEGLKCQGQQKLPVRGKRPRKAENLGLAFTGVCVPSPEDLAVSMRKESESQPSTSAVVHETSSMSTYQERIIKSRMLKQLMKEELRKGKNKYKPHLEYINPLDHSKMTMRDLIYYLPDSNPMTSYMTDEQAGKRNPRLLSNETKEIPQKEAEVEEDDCDEDLSQNDDELVVPKVKVAEDGSLMLDEDSLTVKVSRTTGPTIVEENDPLFERGSTTTYSSFRKIRHVKPWSIKETDMFFLAISMVGTDFSIITQLFPHRPRKEIKNKFRKEERINAWRIDKAFREKRPYDQQFFSMLLGRILATEKKKRNVNTRDSKAKKVNTQESKPKKKKKKTEMEVSVRETTQQDESHITIEEEESDCRVTEGNMEMTEKENEDSINFLKVGKKTLPKKKTGKRRYTEEVADTSAKPVHGKKRKMKTSVEIINCDEVDVQTSSEEPESTMEHTAPGDRSNGAISTLSPSSRRCCQNPTANIDKRVRKRIPGSPENRETCSAEDESRVNSVCVSTVEDEAAILNREEVKKAGQIITPGDDFVEEPENVDCELNRSGCLSHEDLFNSSPSIQHRPREACTLTSITAKKSCQEKEYSASSSPDGVKMDTVHDESAIKYVQDVCPENSEKDSSGQNWTQDEMSRGTDIMDPSLERSNQIPSLAQVAQIQQSSDVSPTITNAAAKASLPTVFEGRDDLENSFTNTQKEKQFDNQNLGHEEACNRDSSDGKTIPEKAQTASLGRRRCQQPKPNLSRVSRGLSVISAKSNEGMKEVTDATEEHLHDLRSVENRCFHVKRLESSVCCYLTFEAYLLQIMSGCLSHEDLFNSSPSIQHRPREACTLTSITAKKSCQEKEYSASSSPDGVKMDTVHDESAIKYVQDVCPENSEKDSSGQNWTQDEMSRGTDIMDPSLERSNQIPSLAQVAQIQQSSDVSPTITNAAAKASLPTVFEGRDDLENSFTNNQKEKQFDNQNLGPEEACNRDSSDGKTIPIKAQTASLGRRRCQQPKPNLSRVSRGLSVISAKSNEGMKEVTDATEEHLHDLRSVENRSGCLSHEDLFNSRPSIQHRPREACTLTSITAKKSCQEKEYSASSSPDGVKMDTVHDESAIKYVQDVRPENSEKDSSGQNWTQDEMSRGTDIMDPSLERSNQIPSLAQVAQIQQSSDVSPTITNAAAKASLPTVFEGRDDLENSFTNTQKEKQFDNQNLGHEEACNRDSSDGKTIPIKAQTASLGRRRCQQPKPNLSRVSRGLSVISAKSNEGMKEVTDATEEHLHDLRSVENRCFHVKRLESSVCCYLTFEAYLLQIMSGCLSHEDLFNSSPSIQHRPREACTLTSITAKKSCQEKEYSASSSPDGVKMDTVHDESAIKYVQDVRPENSEKDSSGQNWTQDEMSRGTDIMDHSLERSNQIPSLAQVAQIQQSSDVSPTITNAAAKASLPTVFEGRDDLENSFTNTQKEKQFDSQNLGHEEACTRDSSNGKTIPKKAQTGSLGRRRCQQPKPNLSRVSRGLSVISSKSNEGMKEVTDATEEHLHDVNAPRSVENSTTDSSDGKISPKKAQSAPLGRRRCQQPNLSMVSRGLSVISVQRNEEMKEVKDSIEEHHEDSKALRSVENSRAYHPLRSPSIREKIPEAVMEKDMQPVQAISSTVTAEVVTDLPPKGDSCGVFTTVAMVTEAVSTDVTEQEPIFILTLVPVSEVPLPPESTEQQSELLLPASQRYSTLERDFVSDQVLNTSSSSITKDTKDPEDHFDTYLEGAASKEAPSIKCKKSFAATNERGAKQNSKRNLPEATKKDQATLREEPERLDILPSSPKTVQPMSVKSTTEESVTDAAEVEMSQDTVYLLDLSIKNKHKDTAEDQSSPTFRSEEEVLKSTPLIAPLFLKDLKLQKNDDDTKTERKMSLDPSIASHSSASDNNATYSPSSPTKVYSNISQPAQCEFLCTSVKENDEEPTNVSEYFFSDIFKEVKESESD